jgi:hypothetical protein
MEHLELKETDPETVKLDEPEVQEFTKIFPGDF